MPYRPLVCKIRCHNPNRSGSAIANRNNIHYMATSESTDLSNEEIETSDDEYLEYMARRPGSQGLFGNIDVSDPDALYKEVYDLTRQGKNIYRIIISLHKVDADLLGYTSKGQWASYVKSVMPDIAKELGVSVFDHSWVAAFHAEKDHPHVHIQLWDNRDIIKSPFIHTSTQNKCRQILSDAMFSEEYEEKLTELLKDEKQFFIYQKNEARQYITDNVKEWMHNMSYVPGSWIDSLPDKFHKDELDRIEKQLKDLRDMLPSSGRMNYQFMPPEVKGKIDEIVRDLFSRKDFASKVDTYVNSSVEIQRMQGKTEYQLGAVRERAMGELYNRAGNIILKKVTAELEKTEKTLDSMIAANDKSQLKFYEDDAISLDRYREMDRIKDEIEMLKHIWFLPSEGPEDISDATEYDSWFDNNAYEKEILIEKGNSETYKFGKVCLLEGENYDPETAIRSFTSCAENGNSWAMYQLGKLNLFGEHVPADQEQGISWLQRAAMSGNSQAMYQMAKLYLVGELVDKNIDVAEEWLQNAVSTDQNGYAAYLLGKIYSDLESGKLDIGQAVKYYEISAETTKNPWSMYHLGKIYLSEEFTGRDLNEAKKWFAMAVETDNNQHAAYQLGNIFFEENNAKAALNYWQVAADQENDYAMWRIGHVKLWGKGIDREVEDGLKWLHKSADEYDNEYARQELEMYENMPIRYLAYGIFRVLFRSAGQEADKKAYQSKMSYERSRQEKKEWSMQHYRYI